jgi:DNA topoisomerase IA
MHLVLTEKSSVAADLVWVIDPGAQHRGGYLEGREYTRTWALGHLAELQRPEHYVPELAGRCRHELQAIIGDRSTLRSRECWSTQLATVRKVLRQVDKVVVTTDGMRPPRARAS